MSDKKKTYRVVAPYVTATVKSDTGGDVMLGFYQGAVIENASEGQHLDDLLEGKYLEEVSGPDDILGAGAAELLGTDDEPKQFSKARTSKASDK